MLNKKGNTMSKKYSVTKCLSNAAVSHRLRNGYPGKCKNNHGHEYFYEVTLSSDTLDRYGMVIDFGEIKKMFDTWIQENWDHASVVSIHDEDYYNFLLKDEQRAYVIDLDQTKETNTTAEWMSQFLFETFETILNKKYAHIQLDEVKVWETETSYASYRG